MTQKSDEKRKPGTKTLAHAVLIDRDVLSLLLNLSESNLKSECTAFSAWVSTHGFSVSVLETGCFEKESCGTCRLHTTECKYFYFPWYRLHVVTGVSSPTKNTHKMEVNSVSFEQADYQISVSIQ